MDVGRFLDIAVNRSPERIALVFDNRRYTYAQLAVRVGRLMTGMARMGVRKGERVATLTTNCSEMIEIYLATVRLGAIFTPLSYRSIDDNAIYLINDAKPVLLFVNEGCRDMAERIADRLTTVQHVFSCSPGTDRFGDYEKLMSDSDPFEHEVAIAPGDSCQLIYTSGTTGKPKGVLLSHENVIWNTLNMLQVRKDRPTDVALIVGPMFHSAALNSHFTSRLALGATSVVLGEFDPDLLLETIQREKITVLSGTPTMFMMLLNRCRPGQYDTASVTTITSGADKCPAALKRNILSLFPNADGICDVYGCTECAPCVTTLSAEDSLIKAESIGRALPFVQVRLIDPGSEDGPEVPVGQTGEIVVRGPNVMQGYYNKPEETAAVLSNGWLRTGDLARKDADGFFYIVDRLKDIIVSGGENIAPKEIEDVMYENPEILKAAVFGVPDSKWGEKVCAAVVGIEGHELTYQALKTFLTGRIERFKVPKEIYFVDQLPESSTGKVRRHILREQYSTRNA